MLTIRTMKQIATGQMVRGFRAGGSREPSPRSELSRITGAQIRVIKQEIRRQKLNLQWLGRMIPATCGRVKR